MVLAEQQPTSSPSESQEPKLNQESLNKKPNKKLPLAIGATLATLLAAGGGAAHFIANSQERAPSSTSDDTQGEKDDILENPVVDGEGVDQNGAETPQNNTETELLTGEALKATFEVPLDTTGEALARAFIKNENQQIMYGVGSDEALDALDTITNGGSRGEMEAELANIAYSAAPTIEEALYTSEALDSNDNVYTYKSELANGNGGSIILGVYTSDNTTGENEEPYKRSSELAEFISSTVNEDGDETIVFTAKTSENVDMNRADEISGRTLDGTVREFTVTYTVEDGLKKINDLTIETLQ